MKKYLMIILFGFFCFSALAEVNCLVQRGKEEINVKIIDSFAGMVAFISRTHPLVAYPTREVYVLGKETSKSFIFKNSADKFSLKLIKEYSLDKNGASFYKGDLKFEDILTKLNCSLF